MGQDESLAQQPSEQNNLQAMGPASVARTTSSSVTLRKRMDFPLKQERQSFSRRVIPTHQTKGRIERKTCFDGGWVLRTCRWHPQRFQTWKNISPLCAACSSTIGSLGVRIWRQIFV
jgi:hypothetical protein